MLHKNLRTFGTYYRTIIIALALFSEAFSEIQLGGSQQDDVISLVYDTRDGRLQLEGGDHLVTLIIVTSESGLFIECINPPGLTDICSATKAGWIDPTGFSAFDFGLALEPDIAPNELAMDLTVIGSLVGGSEFRSDPMFVGETVDLVVVPEPNLKFTPLVGVILLMTSTRLRNTSAKNSFANITEKHRGSLPAVTT